MHFGGRLAAWIGVSAVAAMIGGSTISLAPPIAAVDGGNPTATAAATSAIRPDDEVGSSRTAVAPHPQAGHATTWRAGSRPPRPRTVFLDETSNGTEAIDRLGENLTDVAHMNGMTPGELAALLRADETLHVGRDGRLVYVDAAGSGQAASSSRGEATHPESETFRLHSRSGSNHTIYLDFDGIHLGAGQTYWTDPIYGPGAPGGFYPGLYPSAEPDALTGDQHAFVQTVWRVVAEKFATFDVDVTTEEPHPDAVNRYDVDDDTYGAHVVIGTGAGKKDLLGCGGGCSGIALIGTFNDSLGWWDDPEGYLQPAWVFSDGADPVFTATVTAHEVGHTLGLHHDGLHNGVEYYSGHQNWTPIMGLSTTKAVAQFDRGEYVGAANDQDDFAVMSAADEFDAAGNFVVNGGGLPRLDDAVADDITAASLVGAPTLDATDTSTFDGIIETHADVDVVRVDHRCRGDLTVHAEGIGPGAALDIRLDVLDDTGASLGSDDQPSWITGQDTSLHTGMDASVTVADAMPGAYFARIDGVGLKNGSATVYSDYGSVGQYRLSVDDCVPTGRWAPTSPAAVTVTTDGDTATVAWVAPENPGGATPEGWMLTLDGPTPSSLSLGPDDATRTFTDLAPGTYTVALQWETDLGPSPTAAATFAIGAVPAPSELAAGQTSGPDGVVTWTPPADAAQVLTGYRITGLPGGEVTIDAAATEHAFTGLQPHQSYTITLTGFHNDRDAEPLTTTLTAAPWTPTAQPELTVTITRDEARLHWTEAANPGQATTTGWLVQLTGPSPSDHPLGASNTTLTLSGLNPGNYKVTLVQHTDTGPAPTAAATFTINATAQLQPPRLTRPAPPQLKKIKQLKRKPRAKKQRVRIRWKPPTDTGNTTLTSYRLKVKRVGRNGKKKAASPALAATTRGYVFALPPGRYTVRLFAFNSQGRSPAPAWSKVFRLR